MTTKPLAIQLSRPLPPSPRLCPVLGCKNLAVLDETSKPPLFQPCNKHLNLGYMIRLKRFGTWRHPATGA